MKRTVIGWDIDDVVYPLYPLMHKAAVMAHLGNATEAKLPTTWYPWEEYGCSMEEWQDALAIAIEAGWLYGGEPDAEVVQMILELDRLGVEQHFVTARGFLALPDKVRQQTEDMLMHHLIPHASLTFTRDKGEVARRLNLTHAVDDNVGNYMAFSECGVDTYLWDRPWNQAHIVPPGRRITDPEQFARVIKRGVNL